ncbi:hypothetical protein WA026_014986 [Henosepilachna vigintioctopunctata]|uniref:Reverse transcriptase domain-containing protein n=1 Tax=Henosepilachna vigintioctopunctata TaxID=420089 RepID=A0AAW1U6W7_9CUCU
MFQKLDWGEKGIKINGRYLSHLRFGDDIVLFSHDATDLQERINELSIASKEIGLEINTAKTKMMLNPFCTREQMEVEDSPLEIAASYTYLGQIVTGDGDITPKIMQRTRTAWSTVGRLKHIFKSDMPLSLKSKVFDQCLLPAMTYASETWTLKSAHIQKLRTTQLSIESYMMGLTRRDRMPCS